MSILPKEISATIYTFLFQESHHCTNQALTCYPADQRFYYLFHLKKHPYEANTPKAYTLATVGVTDI